MKFHVVVCFLLAAVLQILNLSLLTVSVSNQITASTLRPENLWGASPAVRMCLSGSAFGGIPKHGQCMSLRGGTGHKSNATLVKEHAGKHNHTHPEGHAGKHNHTHPEGAKHETDKHKDDSHHKSKK